MNKITCVFHSLSLFSSFPLLSSGQQRKGDKIYERVQLKKETKRGDSSMKPSDCLSRSYLLWIERGIFLADGVWLSFGKEIVRIPWFKVAIAASGLALVGRGTVRRISQKDLSVRWWIPTSRSTVFCLETRTPSIPLETESSTSSSRAPGASMETMNEEERGRRGVDLQWREICQDVRQDQSLRSETAPLVPSSQQMATFDQIVGRHLMDDSRHPKKDQRRWVVRYSSPSSEDCERMARETSMIEWLVVDKKVREKWLWRSAMAGQRIEARVISVDWSVNFKKIPGLQRNFFGFPCLQIILSTPSSLRLFVDSTNNDLSHHLSESLARSQLHTHHCHSGDKSWPHAISAERDPLPSST